MANPLKCTFCNSKITFIEQPVEYYIIDCPNCGKYKISYEAREDLDYELSKNIKLKSHLSGAIRELNEKKYDFGLITTENFKDLLNFIIIPKKPTDKMNKILIHLYRHTDFLYQKIIVDINNYSIAYALHKEEFYNLLEALQSLDYIASLDEDSDESNEYYLTLNGHKNAENLLKEVDSVQCFVAMWFEESMLKIFNNVIKKAISDAGYEGTIIPMKEYNDDINDNIIAEIRKSKFIIADFTGNRGGVYFEAGFAEGLGKPVIMMCKNDWFDNEINKTVKDINDKEVIIRDKRSIHFDINHRNFIIWENEDDLYNKGTSKN